MKKQEKRQEVECLRPSAELGLTKAQAAERTEKGWTNG